MSHAVIHTPSQTASSTHLHPATEQARASHLLDIWLANRAPTTVRAYRTDLHQWATWMGMPAPQALGELLRMTHGDANAMGMAWRAAMRAQDLAPATIARRLAALRSVVDAARVCGFITWALDVQGGRVQAYRDTRGPGVDGYRAMMQAVDGDSLQHTRDRALLALLYTMALRRAEVVGLDLADVDLSAGRLWIQGKGRAQQEAVTMPPQTQRHLEAWLAVRGDAPGAVFTTLDRRAGAVQRITLNGATRRVQQIAKRAGLARNVTPHALRHAGITRALDLTGGDARKVMRLSRHAKLDTLMLYDDARTDMGGAVAALLAADA